MTREVAQTRGRTSVAIIAVAGLEVAWLYTLLHIATQGMRLRVSVPSLLLLYAASFMLSLGLRAAFRSPGVRTLVSWLVWPFTTLLLLTILLYPAGVPSDASWTTVILEALKAIPHEARSAIFMVPAGGLLWWLGGRLARSRVTYETVVSEFQFGLLMLVGSVFIGYLVDVDQSPTAFIAVIFVGLGLVGAGVTRVDEGGSLLFFRQSGTWWTMLLISVVVILLLGIIVGLLFTPELMQWVAQGLRALWGLIERLLDALAGLFSSSSAEMELAPGPELPPQQGEDQSFSWGLPESLRRALRISMGVLVSGLALAVLWRIISHLFEWTRRGARRGEVQVESLPGALRLDLARLFRRLRVWLSCLSAFGALRRTKPEEPAGKAAVRRLYADMLRWGADSGLPRRSSQTPFEYQQTLCTALPAHQAEVTLITETYVRVKYGAQLPTEAELHQLKESRRRLKRRTHAKSLGGL